MPCIYLYFQDQLSADLYNFASKEGDYARYYVMVSAPQFSVTDLQLKWKCHANTVRSPVNAFADAV